MSDTHNPADPVLTDFRVDTDIPSGLEAVARFQSIKRWHMIDTSRQQSIAEHSANVALLCYHIAHTAPEVYFGPGIGVLLPALTHDFEEVFMGDIPTHTKKYLGGIDELERHLLPPEYRTDAHNPNVRLLIKLADLADGIRFIERHGLDRVAIWAGDGLRVQLRNKLLQAESEWPEHVFEHCKNKITEYTLL